jgi:hypothetical protein
MESGVSQLRVQPRRGAPITGGGTGGNEQLTVAVTGLHVVGHLPGLPASLRAADSSRGVGGAADGAAGRWIGLAGAIVLGLLLAIVLLGWFGAWTGPAALVHHGDG